MTTPDEAAAREAFRDRLERTWDLLRELDRDENDPELYPNDPERDVSNYVAGLWTTLGRYGDVVRDEVWAALVGPLAARPLRCTCDYAGMPGENHKPHCEIEGGPHAECALRIHDLEAERDSLRARLAAQQPVIDAAGAQEARVLDLLRRCEDEDEEVTTDAIRAALSGSVEASDTPPSGTSGHAADTPAEPERTSPRYLASICDTCGHTYNYHASDGVCTHVKDRQLCPCVSFVDQLAWEVAGTPAAEPADVLPPREPGDLRPAVERALKMLEGSVLAREVLRLRDVADSLRTDLRRERAAAEQAHATVDRLTSAPAAEPAPDHPTGDNACTVCDGEGVVYEDGYYVPGEQFVEPPYEARCEACVGSGQREVQQMAAELLSLRAGAGAPTGPRDVTACCDRINPDTGYRCRRTPIHDAGKATRLHVQIDKAGATSTWTTRAGDPAGPADDTQETDRG